MRVGGMWNGEWGTRAGGAAAAATAGGWRPPILALLARSLARSPTSLTSATERQLPPRVSERVVGRKRDAEQSGRGFEVLSTSGTTTRTEPEVEAKAEVDAAKGRLRLRLRLRHRQRQKPEPETETETGTALREETLSER